MKYGDIIAACDPMQSHWDLDATLRYLEDFEINTMLEIGCYQGGCFATWSQVLKPDHMIGVTKDEVELFPDFRIRVARDDGPSKVDMIFRESQTPEALAEAEAALDGKLLDFLFIDGGHSFRDVQLDFLMYSPLVREGGVVGIHDVNRGCADVYKFWEGYIQQSYRSVVLSDAALSSGLGIGLVLGPGDGSDWKTKADSFDRVAF